ASWRHLSAGNGLERAAIKYDPRLDQAVFERIIAAFPAVEERSVDTTGERPIFILGLPRTGTTLVDRILGSHSQVHSAGELGALIEAISASVGRKTPLETIDMLEFASEFGGLDGATLAGEYLSRARAQRGERPRFPYKNTRTF